MLNFSSGCGEMCKGAQSASFNIVWRMRSIAREAARPLGHTSVQFMIERQRNSL